MEPVTRVIGSEPPRPVSTALGVLRAPQPVRFYLAVLALVVALPLIGLSFYISQRVAAGEREATHTALLTSARSLAATVDREIERHISVAVTLAHSRLLLSADWPAFWQQANESLDYLPGSWVTVVDPRGRVLLNTLRPAGAAPLAERPLWDAEQRALATGVPQVSDMITGVVAGRVGAFAAIPIFRDKAPLYVLDVTLNPDQFLAILRQQNFPAEWVVGIVDKSGRFVARLPNGNAAGKAGELASEGWRNAMRQAREGIAEHESLEGEVIIDAYAPAARGWTAGVGISKAGVEAPLRRTQMVLFLMSLFSMAAAVGLSWIVARRFNRSARALQQAAASMATDKPVIVPPTGIHEYDDAIAGFALASEVLHARATERDRAERALRERERTLETIINRTPFMLTRCSRDLRYLFVSDAYAAMIARRPEDIVGKFITEIMGERGFATIAPHVEKVLAGERVEYEEAVHFADVGTRVLHVVYAPERDESAGVTGWVGSILDITESKRAARAEKMLVHELQHRSNNLLSVIQAIADQSLTGTPAVEAARTTFQARLAALARAHRLLTNSSWTGLNLAELVRAELAPFAGRARIEGRRVILPPREAQNFSLALHELATNAAKHGAFSNPTGEVSATWAVTRNGKDNVIEFEWQERGGPAVAAPARHGFGSKLIATVFPDVRLDYAPAGLRCTIRLLLRKLAAPAVFRDPASRAPSPAAE